MRIISGSKKGLRLKGPKGKETRPTEDRIKESLFNILGDIDRDSLVLDLFAGSGSVGLEFISRGAGCVQFVDLSRNSIDCIKDNINHTGSQDKSLVYKGDYLKALAYFKRKNISFDYIFMDPPYEKGLIKKALHKIVDGNILKEDGLIIVEHESQLDLGDCFQGLEKLDLRNYGGKSITFYRNRR